MSLGIAHYHKEQDSIDVVTLKAGIGFSRIATFFPRIAPADNFSYSSPEQEDSKPLGVSV